MTDPAFDVRSWIKENPSLYDILKRSKRRLPGQNGQPYLTLDQFSRAHRRKVRFIQIGANDGLRNDPVREFIVRDHWTGVLVEPVPQIFELLKRNYPASRFSGLHFVNAAVSAEDGVSLSFWSVADSFLDRLTRETRLDVLRKASFDRAHLMRFLAMEEAAENAIVEIKVPCVTVESLAQRYFGDGRFDLLAIDAEGHEATILQNIDFARVRPSAIFFESHHLGPQRTAVMNRLMENGYAVRDIGGDSMAELLR